MYCNIHRNTELMLRSGGKDEGGEVIFQYCPYCKKDLYKYIVNKEGHIIKSE